MYSKAPIIGNDWSRGAFREYNFWMTKYLRKERLIVSWTMVGLIRQL